MSGNGSGSEAFERFRQLVLADEGLQERLRAETSREEFFVAVVRAGGELGCVFAEEDVEEAMRRERRAWLERWL